MKHFKLDMKILDRYEIDCVDPTNLIFLYNINQIEGFVIYSEEKDEWYIQNSSTEGDCDEYFDSLEELYDYVLITHPNIEIRYEEVY